MHRTEHRSIFPSLKIKDIFKSSQSGTLSPMTTTTTSSGYSTGSSSISTKALPTLKKSISASIGLKKAATPKQQQQQQQKQEEDDEEEERHQLSPSPSKSKAKGFENLFGKLKNLFLTPKHKHGRTMRSMTTRQISTSNILRQYYPHHDSDIYDILPSTSLATSKTITLPFTYYNETKIRPSKTNFEQISAWLNHNEARSSGCEPSLSLSSLELDRQETSVVMKTSSTHIKPPRRSSSLVTKITRPIIEHQYSTPSGTSVDRTNSSTSSFSSSILTRGMNERLTTPTPPLEKSKSTTHQRRPIDYSRRKTLATTTNERQANKENLSSKLTTENLYRFASTNTKSESQTQPEQQQTQKTAVAKHKVTKEYYFHSQPSEDLLNNSYGLTLLQQQQQQQQQQKPVPKPLQPRHSVEAVLMISQLPKVSSYLPAQPVMTRSPAPPLGPTMDSYEDLLCDREVESYFYPVSSSYPSEHVYMNLSTLADPYQSFSPSFDYLHGTLC